MLKTGTRVKWTDPDPSGNSGWGVLWRICGDVHSVRMDDGGEVEALAQELDESCPDCDCADPTAAAGLAADCDCECHTPRTRRNADGRTLEQERALEAHARAVDEDRPGYDFDPDGDFLGGYGQ